MQLLFNDRCQSTYCAKNGDNRAHIDLAHLGGDHHRADRLDDDALGRVLLAENSTQPLQVLLQTKKKPVN